MIIREFHGQGKRVHELHEFYKLKGIKWHQENKGKIQWAGKAVNQFENLGFEDVRLPVTDAFFIVKYASLS